MEPVVLGIWQATEERARESSPSRLQGRRTEALSATHAQGLPPLPWAPGLLSRLSQVSRVTRASSPSSGSLAVPAVQLQLPKALVDIKGPAHTGTKAPVPRHQGHPARVATVNKSANGGWWRGHGRGRGILEAPSDALLRS